ncbi:FtsX-like permease family protein [Egicoccus sp. AB-alg6-2]|uniref:ABC transporter permease n=1 Tax=Egicoccus sp. AB-alg6-2 TaxID=3242692 RepID=UPI00359D79C9
MTVVLAALAALLLAPLVFAAARHRTLLALAIRNIRRRRSEALLVVGGALLGTAIITSALVVGDVLEHSLTDVARTQHGPIDLTVTVPVGTNAVAVRTAIDQAAIPAVEDLLPAVTATATVAAEDGSAAAPRVRLLEVDPDAARGFGSEPSITGLADAPALDSQTLLINAAVADRLDVTAGDAVRVHAYGTTIELTVADVVDEVGLAGYGGAVVLPGTIARLAVDVAAGAEPPREHLLVSLAGGILDTRDATDDAAAQVRAAVAGLPGDPVEVTAEKAAIVDAARRDGAAITELFATVGAFSVLAGILLLVNLFVMLAEERRSELGMLRALGFTRRRLSRTFALEGALYALPAAVLGSLAGVGVGWLVALSAGGLFTPPGRSLDLPLVVEPTSLALGALAGLVISLTTVWLTGVRIARLNVIRAIRELPEPRAVRLRRSTLVLGGLGVLFGGAAGLAGYLGEDPVALLLGVPVAAFSAGPLLRRALPERAARLLVAGTVLGWGLGAMPLFPDIMGGLDDAAFVTQGVVLTAGAVAMAVALDGLWRVLLDRLGGGRRGLAARLGMAYPLARRFRTGMLLAMFSLVLFTVTIISAVTATFERTIDDMVSDVAAGWDVLLDSSPADPVAADDLLVRADVAAVATLTRGAASFEAPHLPGALPATLTGIDDGLLERGTPALFRRDPAYATDSEAFRAVLDDPTLAIVPEGFLVTTMGTAALGVGDTVTVIGADGQQRELRIAALADLDWLDNGALVGRDVANEVLGDRGVDSRSYLAVEGADAEAVAAALDAAFLSSGAEAVSFSTLVTAAVRQQLGFMALVQGFLGLGLLVGISGLAVVMVRAVRERRQAIGMLRAMGFPSRTVRAALLVEAGMIAVQGTAIGVVLGLLTTRQLMAGAEAFGDGQLVFQIPWAALLVIIALPLTAALAATAWPAARAAAIEPATALRTTG